MNKLTQKILRYFKVEQSKGGEFLSEENIGKELEISEAEIAQILRELDNLGYLTHWPNMAGIPFSLSEKGEALLVKDENEYDIQIISHRFKQVGLIRFSIELTTPSKNAEFIHHKLETFLKDLRIE